MVRVIAGVVVVLVAVGCGGTTVISDGAGGSGAGGVGEGAGAEGRPAVCDAAPEELDGGYFLALTVSVSPKKPIPFEVRLATTTTGEQVQAEMLAQPLDAEDRVTKVGEAIAVGPFDVASDGSFIVDWGLVSLPGEANPLTPSVLELDPVQEGSLCPVPCGTVEGEIVSPVVLDLAGSTFFMEKGGTAGSHSEPPVLNCEGDTASPLGS